MKTEKIEMRAIVREGYQILLRADAVLDMPTEQKKMREFYTRMAKTCLEWAEDVYGERLRTEFLSLDGIRERSQYRTQHYSLRMHSPWSDGKYASVLCESQLTDQWQEPERSYHRISHVWNVEEELILPLPQILRGFGMKITRDMLPFHPDGMYPVKDFMVIYRNANEGSRFLEKKIPRGEGDGTPRQGKQKKA